MNFQERRLNKNKKIIGILLLCIFILSFFSPITQYTKVVVNDNKDFEVIPFQKGMSFTCWNATEYNSSETINNFNTLKSLGVEWVAVNAWAYQDYLNSTEIRMDGGNKTYDDLIALFKYARSIGLHILYKPMLNLAKVYDWRSNIIFTPEWMGNYTEWMLKNALVAEEGGAEILSIGCEMGNMQVHSDAVREMISKIRCVYSGLLTYSANHDSYRFVDWYDAIDIIGISMYTMMTLKMDPSVSELTTVWNSLYHELADLSYKWHKPIAFTETGIQALDGSNMIPNDNQLSKKQDTAEMRNFYLSLFNSKVWRAPWFKGAYWWIWDNTKYSPDLASFNPILINETIENEYSKTHVVDSSFDMLLQIWAPYSIFSIAFLIIAVLSFKSLKLVQKKLPQKNNKNNKKYNNNGNNNGKISNLDVASLSLIFSVLLILIFINLTLNLHKIIERSFSYAIILHLSTSTILLLMLIIFSVAVFCGLLILKYNSDLSLFIAAMVIGVASYISLIDISGIEFVQMGLDLIALSLLISQTIIFILKIRPKIERDNHDQFNVAELFIILVKVIFISSLVVLLSILLIKYFEQYAIALLSIPLLITAQIELKKRDSKAYNEGKNKIGNKTKNSNKLFSGPPLKPPIFLGLSLIAGIMFPFGNSMLNLIHMTPLTLSAYYEPGLIASSVIIGVLLIAVNYLSVNEEDLKNEGQDTKDKSFNTLEKIRNFFVKLWTPKSLLYSSLVLTALGFIFILLNYNIFFWAVLSGFYLIQYIGVLLVIMMDTFNPATKGRSFAYLMTAGIMFSLGFIINGIKGLFIYLVTFLTIKNGRIVIRNPQTDPVTSINVPLALNSMILLFAIIVILVLLLGNAIIIKINKKRSS